MKTIVYEKTLHLGEVDYLGNGRKQCPVEVTIKIDRKDGDALYRGLSICGSIWNHKHTDIYLGGQILGEILRLIPHDEKIARLHAIWERYHLNDMHAGCEHQRALGWERDGYDKHPSEPCPECGYQFGTEWKYEAIPHAVLQELMDFEF
ncbi:MAG: hypothetical protein ACE5D4_09730 [Thermodesulfobacteriota bacterium]